MGAKGARRSMNTKGALRKILSTLHPNTILKSRLNIGTELVGEGTSAMTGEGHQE